MNPYRYNPYNSEQIYENELEKICRIHGLDNEATTKWRREMTSYLDDEIIEKDEIVEDNKQCQIVSKKRINDLNDKNNEIHSKRLCI